jgi:hypothetical protein
VNYHSITSDFHGKGRTGKNLGRVVNDLLFELRLPGKARRRSNRHVRSSIHRLRATPRKPQLYGQDPLSSRWHTGHALQPKQSRQRRLGYPGRHAGVTRDRPIDARGFTDAMRRAVFSKRKTTFFEL